jgi:hypothetical protein
MKVRRHGDEAYCTPVGEFIWEVINATPEEGMQTIQAAEHTAHDKRANSESGEEDLAALAQAEKRSKVAATIEAATLGLEVREHHIRSEGKAPDGMTGLIDLVSE